MSLWGLFHQAFSSQFGISLTGNAASKPRLSNKFRALEVSACLQPIQSLPLSALLDPGKLAEKLPAVAQAPGVESGQEKLTPLGSSFVWPVGPIPWSWARGDWDLSYTSLFQNRALSGALEG